MPESVFVVYGTDFRDELLYSGDDLLNEFDELLKDFHFLHLTFYCFVGELSFLAFILTYISKKFKYYSRNF